MHCAAASGMAKGAISGAVGNVKTLCGIVSPLMWTEVYAMCSRLGNPSMLYAGVGALNVLHFLMASRIPPVDDSSESKS